MLTHDASVLCVEPIPTSAPPSLHLHVVDVIHVRVRDSQPDDLVVGLPLIDQLQRTE